MEENRRWHSYPLTSQPWVRKRDIQAGGIHPPDLPALGQEKRDFPSWWHTTLLTAQPWVRKKGLSKAGGIQLS